MTNEIYERITYSKYLVLSGNETLSRNSPISEGMALLQFQDALEMLLRAVAEHFDANIKENMAFDKLILAIDEAPKNQKRLNQIC